METQQAAGTLLSPSGECFTSPFFLLAACLQPRKTASREKIPEGNKGVTGKLCLSPESAPACGDDGPENRVRFHTPSEGWTGKEFDSEVALTYFGARFYDPNIASWISPAPIHTFHNPYVFTADGFDPINSIDPDGRHPAFVFGGVVIVAAARNPTVQQFAMTVGPAIVTRIQVASIAFQSSVAPHLEKIGFGLGVLYGIAKQRLPDHDVGAAELPDPISVPFVAGQAAAELGMHGREIVSTAVGGVKAAVRSAKPGKRIGYGRALNFKPDATATQSPPPGQAFDMLLFNTDSDLNLRSLNLRLKGPQGPNSEGPAVPTLGPAGSIHAQPAIGFNGIIPITTSSSGTSGGGTWSITYTVGGRTETQSGGF